MEYGIRDLAKLAGVSARTLRYYEEIGLLKPLYTSQAGYRFYGEDEVALLQQILFYRERGFDLKSIGQILYERDFDLMEALKEHLRVLEAQRIHVDALIRTVKQTILSMKGEYEMEDQEKFRVFLEQQIKENETKYGAEIREKYGDAQVDASNRRMLKMSQEEWDRFQKLETEIREGLANAVRTGVLPDSQAGCRIVELHREWLSMTWKQYTKEAHRALASMYVCDERFTQYYDQEEPGCAALLEQMIQYWTEKEEG